MKTMVIKCTEWSDAIMAKQVCANANVKSLMGIDSLGFTYIIIQSSILKYYFLKERFKRALEAGADYEIIDTI